jgi:hypothetical protein
MQKSESIASLAKALAQFQKEVKQPKKDADNPFFKSKYVPLDNVVDAINECGPKHGLSFTQWPTVHPENGRIGVTTMLLHESGEWMEFDPLYMNSEKDTAQGAGSVITYARRYSLSAAYGLASETDDDGNEASGDPNKPAQPRQQQSQSNTQQPKKPAIQSQSGAKTVTEPQAKLLGNKARLAEVGLAHISDFLGYEVKDIKQVHFADVNNLIKMLDDRKNEIDIEATGESDYPF